MARPHTDRCSRLPVIVRTASAMTGNLLQRSVSANDLSERRPSADSTPTDASSGSTRRQFIAGLAGVGVVGSMAGCGGRNRSTATEPPDGEGTTAGATDRRTPPEPIGPWPQARADAGNTGFVSASGPTSNPSLRWSVTSAGTVGMSVGLSRGATTRENGLYVATEDGRVAAADPDGGTRWERDLEAVRFPPAIGSGLVVVPGREQLSVLDADSGDRLRSVTVSGGVFDTPALVDRQALVGTFSGGVVAVDLDTGERRWQAGAPSRAHPPTVAGGTAYVTARRWDGGDGSGVVAAVDIESGERRWELSLNAEPTAPPGVRDGVVYAGTNRGRVHAIDAVSGDPRWRESIGDWVTRGPTAAADGIYAVVLGEGIVKLTRDGTVAWRSEAGGQTNPVLTDDVAVIGTREGVVAVGRSDGQTRWRADTDAGIEFDVCVADGRVAAGDRYGTLHTFDTDSGDRVRRQSFRPARMPGPVVGPRTVAGGSRDGGTYSLLATDGIEFPLSGGAATAGITPAIIDGRDVAGSESGGTSTADGDLVFGDGTASSGADSATGETILGGGVDGSMFRVRTVEYGDAPTGYLGLTPTPTPTPDADDPTLTPTPHIDLPELDPVWAAGLDIEVRSPVTYADGRAYLGTAEGVVAVDPRDGSGRWRVVLDDAVTGAPAVNDGRVFAVTESGRLVGFTVGDIVPSDAEWQLDWEVTLSGGSGAGVSLDSGEVIVATGDGNVVAYTTAGDRAWERTLAAGIPGGPAVTDRRAFVGTDAAEVVALSRSDGSVVWRGATRGAVQATPAVAGGASDRTVYAADHDGTLWAFAAADGTVRFRHDVGRWLDAPPAIGHGAVFVADQTGRVSAVVGE